MTPRFEVRLNKADDITEVTFLVPKAAKIPAAPVRQPAAPAVLTQPQTVALAPSSEKVQAPDTAANAAPAAPAAEAAQVEVLSAYELEVASRLNALKRYPDAAKRMRQQGRVMVRFKLGRDGHVLAREIVEASPHATLNEAARSLLSQIQEFKPFPAQTTVTSWVFTVPIEYRL